MWPFGYYERLVHEVKYRENNDIPVTFGILIADYRQTMSREYILNYLNMFDYMSGPLLNFYLPGYMEEFTNNNCSIICIKSKNYYFYDRAFEDFILKFQRDFEVKYSYSPMLVLMEYRNGHFKNTRRIVIDLDSNGNDIRQTGVLFEQLFDIAKKYVRIEDFHSHLNKSNVREELFDLIIEAIDNTYLSSFIKLVKKNNKYKLEK